MEAFKRIYRVNKNTELIKIQS